MVSKIPSAVTQEDAQKLAAALPPFPAEYLARADKLLNIDFNGPSTLLEKLTAAYSFIDKINREYVSKFTTCRKSCSHCCRIDVQLTTFEAEYIAVKTGIPHVVNTDATTGHRGTACPFLKDNGECSIYAHRPLFCRTYHVASDPILCGIPDADVLNYGSMEGGMGNAVFRGFAQWIHYQDICIVGRILLKDIRDFFPHDRERIQRHLRGM